jgi:hypothetical protein
MTEPSIGTLQGLAVPGGPPSADREDDEVGESEEYPGGSVAACGGGWLVSSGFVVFGF